MTVDFRAVSSQLNVDDWRRVIIVPTRRWWFEAACHENSELVVSLFTHELYAGSPFTNAKLSDLRALKYNRCAHERCHNDSVVVTVEYWVIMITLVRKRRLEYARNIRVNTWQLNRPIATNTIVATTWL